MHRKESLTGLILHAARPHVQQQLDYRICGRQNLVEEKKTNHDRLLPVESKVGVERFVVDKDGEESEDVEHMRLADEQQPGGVVHLPVTQLVRQNSFDLLLGALLQESIVDDNLLLSDPRQAREVGVAVRTPLASIDDLEFAQWELKLGCEGFDRILKLSGLERLQLVEHGNDEDGIDSHGRDLNDKHEYPEVIEKALSGFLDDGEKGAANGNAKCYSEGLALDHVRQP